MFDKNHLMITMLREIQENETYYIEIVDDELMQANNLRNPSVSMLEPTSFKQAS